MNKSLLIPALLCLCLQSCAQNKENYDLVSFTAPKGWARQEGGSYLAYTTIDKKDGSWCQFQVFKSVPSKGGIETDFPAEWQSLAATPDNIVDQPQTDSIREADGWRIQAGGARFTFNNREALAHLTTYTGYGSTMSILIKTNKKEYMDLAQGIISAMDLRHPRQTQAANQAAIQPATPTTSSYKFSTTNFADGWTSVIQSDWVSATKGNIQVLVHYPNATTNKYYPDRRAQDKVIWAYFIEPRYSNIHNFEQLSNNLSYESIHFEGAEMTDASGRQHFVALFRKGNSAWVEIIAPDRTAFTRAFGIEKYDVMFDGWKPLEGLPNLNRFAVSTSDLDGKWTTNFSGMSQYVNVYTGASAGTKTYQSHQQYEFSGGHYNWKINVVSGFVGSMNHQEVKGNGSVTMPDNWNVHLSDIEGKPRDYAVFFTAVKDGRVLWIDGNAFVKVQ